MIRFVGIIKQYDPTSLRNHNRTVFFCGDDVLDSFNNASRNEDNNSDQIYISNANMLGILF